jgi:hypothetical protein
MILDTDKNDGHRSYQTRPNNSTKWLHDLMSCIQMKSYAILNKVAENISNIKIKRNQRSNITIRSRQRSIPKTMQRVFISVLALQAVTVMSSKTGKHRIITTFDTDSEPIGVDNRCTTACISHVSTDFVGPLSDSGRTIRGFAGSRTTGIKTGTLRWSWTDNQGQVHTFNIYPTHTMSHKEVYVY